MKVYDRLWIVALAVILSIGAFQSHGEHRRLEKRVWELESRVMVLEHRSSTR